MDDHAPTKPLFAFKDPTQVQKWKVNTDNIVGGLSTASLVYDQHAIFEGNLNLQTTGQLVRSGFAVIKSKKYFPALNLDGYDALEMRIKTDGRIYVFQLKTRGFLADSADDLWQIVIPVIKPGVWTKVVLPFNRFLFTWRGGWAPNGQEPPDVSKIEQFGVLMAQRKEGYFKFEIDWINAIRNLDRKEKRRFTCSVE